MSSIVGAGLLNDLVRDITATQIFSYITVASATLIFHDWFLTSHEELTFVWRRGGSLYVRVLFVGARYTALACALLYWFPARLVLAKVYNVVMSLDIVVVICSELIFVLRTWAIWERSRAILVFLLGLIIAFVILGIVVIKLSESTALVTSSITVIFEGVGRYEIPTRTVQYAWVASTPFLLLLVLQSGVSSCLVVILSESSLRLCSCVGLDFIQSVTIP